MFNLFPDDINFLLHCCFFFFLLILIIILCSGRKCRTSGVTRFLRLFDLLLINLILQVRYRIDGASFFVYPLVLLLLCLFAPVPADASRRGPAPARATVEVGRLAGGAKVEIVLVAYKEA